MELLKRILNSELFLMFLAFVLLIIVSVFFIVLPVREVYVEAVEHQKIHNQGYEILEKKESFNRTGYPCFYYIVEYTDGCVEEIRVEPEVYYERVDKNEI